MRFDGIVVGVSSDVVLDVDDRGVSVEGRRYEERKRRDEINKLVERMKDT